VTQAAGGWLFQFAAAPGSVTGRNSIAVAVDAGNGTQRPFPVLLALSPLPYAKTKILCYFCAREPAVSVALAAVMGEGANGPFRRREILPVCARRQKLLALTDGMNIRLMASGRMVLPRA